MVYVGLSCLIFSYSTISLQIMTFQLRIDGAKISFEPTFRVIREMMLTLMSEIVTSAQELPRVRDTCTLISVKSVFQLETKVPCFK